MLTDFENKICESYAPPLAVPLQKASPTPETGLGPRGSGTPPPAGCSMGDKPMPVLRRPPKHEFDGCPEALQPLLPIPQCHPQPMALLDGRAVLVVNVVFRQVRRRSVVLGRVSG